MRAIRTPRYKYIRNYAADRVPLVDGIPSDIQHNPSYPEWVQHGRNTVRAPEELYDLVADPLEEHNLIDSSSHQSALQDLRDQLDRYLEETNDPIVVGPYPAPPDSHIDNARLFEHIPEVIFAIRGTLIEEDGVLVLNTQVTPHNPEKISIPLVDAFEEWVGLDFVATCDGRELRGTLQATTDDALVLATGDETHALADLVELIIDSNVYFCIEKPKQPGSHKLAIYPA
jgi:hypothetical protein